MLILLSISVVLINWNAIANTRTFKVKMKVFESIQKNELDSAKMHLEEYLDSIKSG